MIITGITGTLGAGKGTVADFLVKEKGFRHYSVRDFLVSEIEKRGLPINRDSMVEVANDLRKNNSPSYIIEQLVLKAKENGGNAVIESVRAVAEAKRLKEMGALLLSVDARQNLRYERAVKRGSVTDDVTFEKFVSDEKREMNSSDPTKQSIADVMQMADIKIENNGTIEKLEELIDVYLKKYL